MNDQKLINQAVAILRQGGLVAMPTETVYGLGADASNSAAIAKVFAAKERPADHPLIVHLGDVGKLTDWAMDIAPAVYQLAAAFWPGPLTLILKKQPHVSPSLTGGQQTVGVRIPRHPVALSLLQAFGGGIAAPSANKFTHISPTTAEAVKEELGDKVDLILDGGHCEVGLESTILDMSGLQPLILRPGMISAAQIEAVLGVPVLVRSQDVPNEVRAPGMHHLHYAPQTPVQLVMANELEGCLAVAKLPVALLTLTDISVQASVHRVRMSQDPNQYAHDLYHVLRRLDQQQFNSIIIEAVPASVGWDAIRDRLSRAAGRAIL